MHCPICQINNCQVQDTLNGLDQLEYKIYYCQSCGSSFTKPPEQTLEMYDQVYKRADWSSGYDKYFQILKKIKESDNPLHFLLQQQPLYLPIYNFLHGKSHLEILEVGCGLGYLTYALRQLGHEVRGIDISQESIDLARNNFGDHFISATINDLAESALKFDLIIATEVIEHVNDPCNFVKTCKHLLKDSGVIILTTPNKDYYGANYTWNTELPPLHLFWLGSRGLEQIASASQLCFNHFDYLRNGVVFWEQTNLLTDYVVSRKLSYKDYYPNLSEANIGNPSSFFKKLFVDFYLLRIICNLFFSLFCQGDLSKYVIRSVILTKKIL